MAEPAHPQDPAEFARRVADIPEKRNLARGLPLEVLTDEALLAAARAASLSEQTLRMIVQEACQVAEEPAEALLLEALQQRCQTAPSLIRRYVTL